MLFPLIPLLAAFLFDKLFFIGEVPYYFLNTASFVNYDHKEELIFELKDYLSRKDRKKVVAIFGNSRTTPFNNAYIESKHPDWILFNFSVPGGTSDYYCYLMEKFQKNNIHPDHMVFAITPQGFNSVSRIQMDEVMVYALPPSFIARNISHFSIDDMSNYIAKKLFLGYRNKPLPAVILRRTKNNSRDKELLKEFIINSKKALHDSRGSVALSKREPKTNRVKMEENAEDIFRDFLSPFQYSKNQHFFMEESLKIAVEMKIPSSLLWARVSPELRLLKNEIAFIKTDDGKTITIRGAWEPRQRSLAEKYGVKFLDMNDDGNFKCDKFIDASHMSGICFDDFTDYLFSNIEGSTR